MANFGFTQRDRLPGAIQDELDSLYARLQQSPAGDGVLIPINGGTGLELYVKGDLLVATDPETLGVIPAVAVGQVLVSQGEGAEPVWSADPVLTGSITVPNAGLRVKDTDDSHILTIQPGSNLSEDRTLTIITGDADRTLALSGDATISGTNTGDVTLSGSPDYLTLTGQTIVRGLVNLETDVEGRLPFGNFVQATAASRLLGRGATTSGDFQEITIGDGLTISGTTLTVSGSSGGGSFTVVGNSDTGAQNNWTVSGVSGNTLIEWSGASAAAVTGIEGGVAGQILVIKNTGSSIITFAHNSGSSDADNRLQNVASSAPTPVAARGWVRYQHDGTDWKMVAHEQGSWITPAYNASDFLATGASAAWTVESGDRSEMSYYLQGRMIHVAFRIVTSSVTQDGVNPFYLQILNGQWGGFTGGGVDQRIPIEATDAGTAQVGFAFCGSAGATTAIRCGRLPLAQWSTAVNNTAVIGVAHFQVT